LEALPPIATVALAAPGTIGAKPIVAEHLPFGPTGPLQLVAAENSFDPEMLAPAKVTVAPPFLFAVLVSITILTLCFPIFTLPKFTELPETLRMTGTLGTEVAFGVGTGGVGVSAGVGVGVKP
jgi:hypothetical protein